MSKDQHAHVCQVFIAAYVINMDMGIDQKPNFFVGHLLHDRYQSVRQRCEQGVHQEYTVGTNLNADVTATTWALYHVNIAGDEGYGKFHPGKIPLTISEAGSS